MSQLTSISWPPELIHTSARALRVGRGDSVDVLLPHPGVSRLHAEIWVSGGRLRVRDLGSSGGTRVNGERLAEAVLQEGDRVAFGPVAYLVQGQTLRLQTLPGVGLETRSLAVTRGERLLLEGISLTIQPNQFVGILGSSGAGKSTLLKCLASYLPKAAGLVLFDGQNADSQLDGFRAVTGHVPQQDLVFDLLTVRENLQFALQLRAGGALSPAEQAAVIDQALERLGLQEEAQRLVGLLSGGQRKRVNVAQELLSRPRLLFLDEPTAGLDPANETRLMQLLRKAASWGTTVVCATHIMDNLALFDRVIVLARGAVVYAGPPADVLRHFQVGGYPELYEHLETLSTTPTNLALGTTSRPGPVSPAGLTTPAALLPSPGGLRLVEQLPTLLARGLRLVVRDRSLLGLLASQPVLIGLFINLSQQRPNGLSALFLFAVVTSIWLGLNNMAREVVRDRPIYLRERLVGVTPEAYLTAKVVLFGLVGLLQVLMLVGVIRFANFLGPGDARDLAAWPVLYLFVVLWATYLAAMLLGLIVSTLAPTQEAAVAVLPLVVLPQLLLTGVATGLASNQDGSFRSLLMLAEKAGTSRRSLSGWLLELLSQATYSRPALSLLHRLRPDEVSSSLAAVYLVDWLHLLLLLLATGAGLLACFHRQEQHWLRQM